MSTCTRLLLAGALALMTGRAALAADGDGAKLRSATVPGAHAGTEGTLDRTLAAQLVFRAPNAPEIGIPYDRIVEFSRKTEDAFHLGFFPAMFFGMFFPRPQVYTISVAWRDAAGTMQAAMFEVAKDESASMLTVLYARARQACERREYGSCSPVVPMPVERRPLSSPASQTSAGNIEHAETMSAARRPPEAETASSSVRADSPSKPDQSTPDEAHDAHITEEKQHP